MAQSSDRLDALVAHFPVRARMFHAGVLCGITPFDASEPGGQMHVVRRGPIRVVNAGGPPIDVIDPSLLLYARPVPRRFVTDPDDGADLVCASLRFEGTTHPIADALPDFVCLPLADIAGAAPILSLLFDEAVADRCGRRTLIDSLFEVLMVQVLRQLMETDEIRGGMLAGLAHPRLRRALTAMHEQPAQPWSLDTLAETSSMSRSVFASTFREVVGCTPGAYLQGWRVRLAQEALLRGQPLKVIADEVGYGSEAALSRAFKAQCGLSPREWRLAEGGG